MSKYHTLGSWQIGGIDQNGWHRVLGPNGQLIAIVINEHLTSGLNATLIAAAPDLLDVLLELVEVIEAVREGEGDVDTFTLQPAREVIAHATGGILQDCSICRCYHGPEIQHKDE